MRKNNVKLFLLILKLLSVIKGAVSDYYDEYARYEEENFHEEEEEEKINTFQPKMMSQPREIVVEPDTTIRLPCQVDVLPDDLVAMWSKVDPLNTNNYLAVGKSVISKDHRVSVDVTHTGSSLIIALAKEEDQGTYNCTIASTGDAPSVTHTVKLAKMEDSMESKSLERYQRNRSEKKFLEASLGDDVTLICNGRGNPPPQIFWTKVGSLFSDGSDTKESSTIVLRKVMPDHAGTYQCTGSNGRGPSATDQLSLHVLYRPMVKVDKVFLQKEVRRGVELSCRVDGWPAPEVEWSMGGRSIDSRVVRENGVVSHRIYLEEVGEEDYGKYECWAGNSLGNISKAIEIFKLASAANFHSSPKGREENTFLLEWSVYSFSPVSEFLLQVWRKGAWQDVGVKAREAGTYHWEGQYYINQLEGGTRYKARVAAVNKKGQSKHSATFYFYTKGAGPRQAEIISGEDKNQYEKLPLVILLFFVILQ